MKKATYSLSDDLYYANSMSDLDVIFSNHMERVDAEKIMTILVEKIESSQGDLRSYEFELEENTRTFQDILETLTEIQDLLSSPRSTSTIKKKIMSNIEDVVKAVNNSI